MIRKYKSILLGCLIMLTISNGFSRRYIGPNSNKGGGNNPTPTSGCATAVAIATLELNNVRTRIEATGGSMWQDRSNGIADYEVPKRSNLTDPKQTAIFAGALWMGGLDVNGQLKIAAVTFRAAGNDFWPGPLSQSTADIDAATCSAYDKFYGISKKEVDKFIAFKACEKDPNCDANIEFPGYQIPDVILNWPAHGDVSKGQDWHLAPFFDVDGDDFYDPSVGDYPKYDILGEIDCRTTRDIRLFGDTTIWFVFNDKGNSHTESNGPSIGMEIRGQAFAFTTNDEVNNMTFYNYEMINRSTFTLTETYFGQWVDADLGNSADDYVGCDAQRGLGYCYNGDAFDEDANGISGYGTVPPVIGVDFFEGPFQDNDGIDNPLTTNVQNALALGGIPYAGLGIGYGDGIIDNERYGMKKFVYYSIGGGVFPGDGDPQSALDHYNYLRGRWRNGGSQMVWGGNGNGPSTGGTVLADLLFPGDSDPLFWSTKGISASPASWTEASAGNLPGDRRFLESAGPFTLEPGAVNDLTVGVVYARAISGDNLSSISVLQVADDKAQALFDNCFKIAEGPDAPSITFQEMENELILYLTNPITSNNYQEKYNQKNPFIAIPDTLDGVYQGTQKDKDTLKFYEFEGYQIYQLKNGLVTADELNNPDKAVLIAQVDIENGIKSLVNYTFNETYGFNVPEVMVDGGDKGIKHSFRIKEDQFASGNKTLVNHKTYYFMATAYGYNEYKEYDPNDPMKLDGQKQPYISSRKTGTGQGLRPFSAIPHNPAPENGGTVANSTYGGQPQITRIEGQGNGGNELELVSSSRDAIVANGSADFLTYQAGFGPIDVKVVDPLNVQAGKYTVQFIDTTGGGLSDAFYALIPPSGGDTIFSEQAIALENEQLFLDYGVSVTIKQAKNPGIEKELGNGAISGSVVYEDPTRPWLGGLRDVDGESDFNWIRSGTSVFDVGSDISPFNDYQSSTGFKDPNEDFEGFVNRTWAPYGLVANRKAPSNVSPSMFNAVAWNTVGNIGTKESKLEDLQSVDVVFTSDQSKWSRCLVFEARNDSTGLLTEGNAKHLEIRKANSVDKNGNNDGSGTQGFGWFPGYAVNVETGERLNVAFAEDSWLAGENGRDMKWNPTSTFTIGVNNDLVMGGKHYVYVFRRRDDFLFGEPNPMPAYDGCAQLNTYITSGNGLYKAYAISSCIWAGIPMLNEGYSLLETEARVKLRVEKSYSPYTTAHTTGTNGNGGLPMYEFDMTGMEVDTGVAIAMDSALAMINVVPNPYYAYSEYETGALDNKIKITNLPKICTISIYNVNGTLMRRFQKADEKTSLDWDLKNHVDVPVASGIYLIHVKVPNVGERTLKWYGVIKPTDLNGF